MAGASLLIDCHDEVKVEEDVMKDAMLLLSRCLINETTTTTTTGPFQFSAHIIKCKCFFAAIRRYAGWERKPMGNTTVTEAHESAGLGAS